MIDYPAMAGLVPVILTRTEFAKDVIPDSKHSMEMVGTSPRHGGVRGARSTSTARAAGITAR
jgi:hypothetical protein